MTRPLTYPTQDHPGARWLVSRTVHPRLVHEAWDMGCTAGIEVGHHFDIVHLSARAVEDGIVGVRTDEAIRSAFLTAGIAHGVIASRRRDSYTVLVPPGTARTWDAPDTTGTGADDPHRYLRAPHPRLREGPGAFWLLPVPLGDEHLADPALLRSLLVPPPPAPRRLKWGSPQPPARA
ncbi:hypothetical protein AC230_09945 [Streptomyces caatingaensis]|uniref:DNA primase/polymerase bifunctional N-terminal domain-containing protein n=2 Tax=Streptomyces caatingaensis TaxID=1678637 RepID=A0A0K9XHQ3_9ACTN|nr:hypothetical protein AC230_09945 [Streptomyces caatingaensis]